jgi:hypothetical protein
MVSRYNGPANHDVTSRDEAASAQFRTGSFFPGADRAAAAKGLNYML